MAGLLSEDALAWIGRSDPPLSVEVSRRDIVKYSISTEQVLEKYLTGDEAPPMFVAGLSREVVPLDDLGPDGLAQASLVPDLPLKRVMAGGVEFDFHRTVHPGDVLVFERSLSSLTEKQGRTGPLIFVTYTINCRTEAGEPVLEQKQTRILR
ncbi:MAG: MaoC family dehydratase N-terminal domain-containing protein [Alphaproteobacteria bacterium]|jgi:3-methylfumaryl-CoA hydratase|nr:MaoC family dehydratase N-terminal domain-containing protein [Alphaproteobacteria bacterium]